MDTPMTRTGEFLCNHILDNAWYFWRAFEGSIITLSTLKMLEILPRINTQLLQITYHCCHKRISNVYKVSHWGKVQFSSVPQLHPTLCDPMDCNTPGLPVHHQLPEFTKLMSIESVMPSSRLILCRPLLLLPSIFPSIRVFSNESALPIRWPKYWSFSFSISPSNEHPGLISFRMDWLDLLAVQGTLKSLLQHHQFFSTQLSSQSSSHIHT